MQHVNLFSRLNQICDEVERLHKENPTGPDEEEDPRIVLLLAEVRAIQKELDPVIRVTLRNDPAKLAGWGVFMQMFDDSDEEDDRTSEL